MIITETAVGRIKELNGVNCAPYNKRGGSEQTRIRNLFTYCGITRSRLHDCCGGYGGCYFVDIPNIFRDFDADENDPKSYDFYYTDEYITAIVNSGTKIVYRLGITIEWGSKKYRAVPPKDFAKWARICEHIVRHYNEGWADGFKYGIEYWEIWNEPENPPMWQGTREEYFELYKISSKHLKKCFPDIKIGGYGGCGFYAAFIEEASDFRKSFLTWYDEFIAFVKKENCPLDFYSWHIYTDNIDYIVKSSDYVRSRLDAAGFTETESHLNEWNYGEEGKQSADKDTVVGASFVAAAFSIMQNSSIDLAQYYVATHPSVYNGLMYMRSGEFTPVAHVFHSFSEIYRAQNSLKIESNDSEPYAVAASNGKATYALISSYKKCCDSFTLCMPHKKMKIYGLCDAGFGLVKEAEDTTSLPASKYSVYYVVAE